jgi:tRNA-(ms[2]io[6]A)-hydroxylase
MKKSVQLKSKTDPKWVHVILENFPEFMADHADCERKASAMAMHMVAKYWDRSKIHAELIDLAMEELLHFKQVYALMEKRGIRLLESAINDPYVNQLLAICRHGRDTRFLDKFVMLSVIEARGAERFRIVAEHLEDPELKAFYRSLYTAEARHGNLFVNLAMEYFTEEEIDKRLDEFTDAEAKIVEKLKWRPSLH